MKTPFSIKCVVMAFALICISANAQKTKKPVANQYATIVQKLSQDIVLTNEQKMTIKLKTDSMDSKSKNALLGVIDSSYMDGNYSLRKDIINTVLTEEQKRVLNQKHEDKKLDILKKIKNPKTDTKNPTK